MEVKLLALKLRKHASIWWSSMVFESGRKGKGRIKTWGKMRAKLKFIFPPTLKTTFLNSTTLNKALSV